MIPKVIHYCWFGKEKPSPFIQRCMATWKKVMPDYKIRCWTDNDIHFLLDTVSFLRDAYNTQKWAFVADYVRLYALYTEGGIYMDTDVKVVKRFDEFLRYSFFSSHEKHPFFYNKIEQTKLTDTYKLRDELSMIEGFGILSAVMGSEARLPFLKDCVDYYNSLTFDLNMYSLSYYTIGKHITRLICRYGYRFIDEDQLLKDNMLIKESSVFVGNMIYYVRGKEYAIHLCNGSWVEENKNWLWQLRNRHTIFYTILVPFVTIYQKMVRLFNSTRQ